MSLVEMHYAHHQGLASIKFTPDGSYIVTGGADGDVRFASMLTLLYSGVGGGVPL